MRTRKTTGYDRAEIVKIINKTANLTQEEKDCATELLDIYLNNPLQNDYFFLTAIDEADCPRGYVCYGPTPLTYGVYDLYWILVDADNRGRGIGARLLGDIEEILKGRGARLFVAETSGLASYEPARSFYEKNGFKEESRIKEFYKPGDDLITYVKRF